MRGRLIGGLVGAAIALGVIACNALTGASDLGICVGSECADLGPTQLPIDDAGGGGNDANGGSDGNAGDTGLPPTCVGDEKRCAGNIAAHCVNGTFQNTTCAETCLNGDCTPYLSCRNAAGNTCNPDGGAGSCCESIAVPTGTYNRFNDGTKAAMVSAFKLDKLEVTVARFRAFVDANEGTLAKPPASGAGLHPKIANSGWNPEWSMAAKGLLRTDTTALKISLSPGTWTNVAGGSERRPITNVSWFEAFAFCAWDGGRLPTNAEWNYASAGGSEHRLYPWTGNTITEEYANYDCDFAGPSYNCTPIITCVGGTAAGMNPCDVTACTTGGGSCQTTGQNCTGCAPMPAELAPVGSLPMGAGRWGHLDLAGNVAEWVLDASGDKDNILLPTPCTDCARLVPGDPEGPMGGGADDTFMLTRGGAWNTLDTNTPLRNTSAEAEQFETRSTGIGFRCARD